MVDPHANPFAPPGADVEPRGELPGTALRVGYRLRRMDDFLWNLVHQFRNGHSQGAHIIPSRAFVDKAHRSQFISVAKARCTTA